MHYHFTHYGTFSYSGRTDLGSKRAFCLESSKRYANNERTPSWSDFNCHNQGISEGWGDQYNAGFDCQWVDVTSFDTSATPITKPLGFNVNPDGFLCEGTQALDSKGNLTWEPTAFKTDQGDTVDRPVCKFKDGWTQNNAASVDVTLPVPGEGLVTSSCTRGQLGKLRNCGFTYDHEVKPCDAGTTVTLSCSAPAESAPQVVRVCEASHVLGSGLACTDADALGTAETDMGAVSISFTCPRARDDNEPGGSFAVYTGPSYPADEAAMVTCTGP
jgi:hypothetical protein